jgi:hypothetical protein
VVYVRRSIQAEVGAGPVAAARFSYAPREMHERILDQIERANRLGSALSDHRSRVGGRFEQRQIDLSSDERAELEAIGYIDP